MRNLVRNPLLPGGTVANSTIEERRGESRNCGSGKGFCEISFFRNGKVARWRPISSDSHIRTEIPASRRRRTKKGSAKFPGMDAPLSWCESDLAIAVDQRSRSAKYKHLLLSLRHRLRSGLRQSGTEIVVADEGMVGERRPGTHVPGYGRASPRGLEDGSKNAGGKPR